MVVTLGSNGCMLVSSTSEGCQRFPADKVHATDTVGAGDAFLGSLGAYLARGMTLEDAIGKAVRYERKLRTVTWGAQAFVGCSSCCSRSTRRLYFTKTDFVSAFCVRLQQGGETCLVIQDAAYTSQL